MAPKMSYLTQLRHSWQLKKQQWLSPAQLTALRLRKLQSLIQHAYERVPYYRRLFDAHGVLPRDISSIEDLQKLPVLTKQKLQQTGLSDFLAEGTDPGKCILRTTSGSTGLPLNVCRTRREYEYGNQTVFRTLRANGARPWHRYAIIQDPEQIPGKRFPEKTSSRIYLRAGQQTPEQLAALRAFKPHVILGYSNSLQLIAHAIKQSGITDLSPRLVVSCAELLDEPSRALINEAFGTELVDLYAAVETRCIAWECRHHSGYHINADTLIVEFIRDGKTARTGEPGRIVVTPLFPYAMPLIRYDLGDIGVTTDRQCPCRRGLPLMELIQGRADDFISLRSGRVIAPVETFASIIEKAGGVSEYLVVQESYDLICVKLVLREGEGSDAAVQVSRGIEDLIRHEAEVKVETVDRIDRGDEAKLRRIISKVTVNL